MKQRCEWPGCRRSAVFIERTDDLVFCSSHATTLLINSRSVTYLVAMEEITRASTAH